MTQRQQDLTRWLEAEDAGGDWDAADAAFAAVASEWLPMSYAPAGLTRRIMAALPRRVETRWARAVAGVMASRWVRATTGAAILVVGAAVAVVGLGQFVTVGSLFTGLATGGHAVLDAVSMAWDACTAAWPVMTTLGQAAADVAATRIAALVILINLVLATGAFAGLSRLRVFSEEES